MDPTVMEVRKLYLSYENICRSISETEQYKSLLNRTESDIDLVEVFRELVKSILFKIAVADYIVLDEEVEYINYIVDDDASSDMISGMTDFHGDLLDSVIEGALALDIIARIVGKDIAEQFIGGIEQIGLYLIAIDGDNDEDEIETLSSIIKSLKNAIENTIEERNRDDVYQSNHENNLESSDDVNINEQASSQPIEESFDDVIEELNTLIGLENVKNDVRSLVNLVKIHQLRIENNMPVPPMSFHLVFSGNPGTGKTTVARLLAKIYKSLGLLNKGHLIEVDRSALVAGFVGQTAIKVSDVVKQALGGVLFIDEAYTLSANNDSSDYGREAIDTLLKLMEDHRDDLIVIVAGYTDEMKTFLHSNPGLKSRFNKHIHFEDYQEEELVDIFLALCNKSDYILTDNAKKLLQRLVLFIYKNKSENFSNGREMRNKFEEVLQYQANRIMLLSSPTKEDLQIITHNDILPLLA